MKRGKNFTIKINFSNRVLYTLITLGILSLFAVGVYAAQQSAAGGTHSWAEVGIPSCSNGQVLKYSNGWACGTDIDTDTDTNTDYCAGGLCGGNLRASVIIPIGFVGTSGASCSGYLPGTIGQCNSDVSGWSTACVCTKRYDGITAWRRLD